MALFLAGGDFEVSLMSIVASLVTATPFYVQATPASLRLASSFWSRSWVCCLQSVIGLQLQVTLVMLLCTSPDRYRLSREGPWNNPGGKRR